MRFYLLQRSICCWVANHITDIILSVRNHLSYCPPIFQVKKENWVCEITVLYEELLIKSINFHETLYEHSATEG